MISMMSVSCPKCGESADIDDWKKRVVAGDLPANQFQCPKCQFAFKRVPVEKPELAFTPERKLVLKHFALVPCDPVM